MRHGPLFIGELKPCPFCGGEAKQDAGFADEGPYIVCPQCEAGGPARKTHALAAKAWNRRPLIQRDCNAHHETDRREAQTRRKS